MVVNLNMYVLKTNVLGFTYKFESIQSIDECVKFERLQSIDECVKFKDYKVLISVKSVKTTKY